LIGLQDSIEVLACFLVLQVTQDRFVQLEFEIRGTQAGLVLLGFMDHFNFGIFLLANGV
jgi:hypothetical protein